MHNCFEFRCIFRFTTVSLFLKNQYPPPDISFDFRRIESLLIPPRLLLAVTIYNTRYWQK